MYRPNFCAECGERIERTRWRPWTSRRFCEACAGRFRGARFTLPLAACTGLVLAGFIVGQAFRHPPPPLIIERRQGPALAGASGGVAPPSASRRAADPSAASLATTDVADATRYGRDGTPDERPTEPDEAVSLCGARTKKGAPCSRRVRGTGRCWQHRGKPAMLPPTKLILKE